MEPQVTISLTEYDELRKFKEEIEKNNSICIEKNIIGTNIKYITRDEMLHKIEDEFLLYKRTSEKVRANLDELNKKSEYLVSTLRAVKNMSVKEFKKWKTKINK